ncbi:MAG TPA: hypothetical protein VF831_09610 [Anaerolineales bacterium]
MAVLDLTAVTLRSLGVLISLLLLLLLAALPRLVFLLLSRWLGTGSVLLLTPVSDHMLILLTIDLQDRGLENVWIMDSGCSRHMTGHRRWFSRLTPMSSNDYVTFGDNGQGKILGVGNIRISSHFFLSNVALVEKLGFNLISVSQLLEDGLEVRFRKGDSCIVDTRGAFICQILPFGRVFRVDFSSTFGPSRCLMAGSSSEL